MRGEKNKTTIGTVCSTGRSQTNMTLSQHSMQIVPDAAVGSPPSLLSASATPTWQGPSTTPALLEGSLSPFSPPQVLPLWTACRGTCCHLAIKTLPVPALHSYVDPCLPPLWLFNSSLLICLLHGSVTCSEQESQCYPSLLALQGLPWNRSSAAYCGMNDWNNLALKAKQV